MTQEVKVRPAVPADAQALARIHVAGYEEAYRGLIPDDAIDVRTVELRERTWRERLSGERGREFVLVAELDGEVAGFVSGRTAEPAEGGVNGSIACWENLYLEPGHIGTGAGLRLGFALHEATLGSLSELGFSEAVAFVIEGNQRALSFFESLGWQLDGGSREVEGMVQHRVRRALPRDRAVKPLKRTREQVEREYGEEKWPAMERLIEEVVAAEPDIGLARAHARVAASQWHADDPLEPRPFVVDGEAVPLPRSAAFGAAAGLVLELVRGACTDETDLVVELGSGWGWHILNAWLGGGPRNATYVAAEYTDAGRRAVSRLAELDERLRFRAVPFDYHEPDFGELERGRHAVVFTAHSIEQIPQLTPGLFEAIRSLAEHVTCLHFEPAGWQVEGHDGRGSSAAYAEQHDYNRNLVELLRADEAAGRLELDFVLPDVFGINPKNSTTVIRWRS